MENIYTSIFFLPYLSALVSRYVHSIFVSFFLRLFQFLPHVEKLDDFEHFLQLHNKLPVTLLHLIAEPVFEGIDGLPADL